MDEWKRTYDPPVISVARPAYTSVLPTDGEPMKYTLDSDIVELWFNLSMIDFRKQIRAMIAADAKACNVTHYQVLDDQGVLYEAFGDEVPDFIEWRGRRLVPIDNKWFGPLTFGWEASGRGNQPWVLVTRYKSGGEYAWRAQIGTTAGMPNRRGSVASAPEDALDAEAHEQATRIVRECEPFLQDLRKLV